MTFKFRIVAHLLSVYLLFNILSYFAIEKLCSNPQSVYIFFRISCGSARNLAFVF